MSEIPPEESGPELIEDGTEAEAQAESKEAESPPGLLDRIVGGTKAIFGRGNPPENLPAADPGPAPQAAAQAEVATAQEPPEVEPAEPDQVDDDAVSTDQPPDTQPGTVSIDEQPPTTPMPETSATESTDTVFASERTPITETTDVSDAIFTEEGGDPIGIEADAPIVLEADSGDSPSSDEEPEVAVIFSEGEPADSGASPSEEILTSGEPADSGASPSEEILTSGEPADSGSDPGAEPEAVEDDSEESLPGFEDLDPVGFGLGSGVNQAYDGDQPFQQEADSEEPGSEEAEPAAAASTGQSIPIKPALGGRPELDDGDFGSGASIVGVGSANFARPEPTSTDATGYTVVAGSTDAVTSEADPGVGTYEEALVVEISAEVAYPAEADGSMGRDADSESDDPVSQLIANSTDDGGGGRGDSDDFDLD